jgi:hypothetical protein
MVKNAYSEKPEFPYKKTRVDMSEVIAALKGLNIPVQVKRSAYVIFRFESRNGEAGVCNNYAGLQADTNRWPAKYDPLISGTCVTKENGTGNQRRFLVFHSISEFLQMYTDRLKERGLYVGGSVNLIAKMVVTSERDLARAYEKDWVKGNKKAEPTEIKINNFLSMYAQAIKLFS